MRYLLLIIMIALLPLRALAGDAMALGMLASALQPPSAVLTLQVSAAAESVTSHAHQAGSQPSQASQKHQTHAQPSAQLNLFSSLPAVAIAADCTDHSMSETTSGENSHCNTCSACQTCHTLALSATAAAANPGLNPRELPSTLATPFVSAEAALGVKPPIS